jgi:hypothetical protein
MDKTQNHYSDSDDQTHKSKKRKHTDDAEEIDTDNEQTNTIRLQQRIKTLEHTVDTLHKHMQQTLNFNSAIYTYIGNLEQHLWAPRFPPRLRHLLCNTEIETDNGKKGTCIRDMSHDGPCVPIRQNDDHTYPTYSYDKTFEFINKSWTAHEKRVFTEQIEQRYRQQKINVYRTENGSHN